MTRETIAALHMAALVAVLAFIFCLGVYVQIRIVSPWSHPGATTEQPPPPAREDARPLVGTRP